MPKNRQKKGWKMKEKKDKNRIICFTIADSNNMRYYKKLKNSLKYWHPDLELRLIGGNELQGLLQQDPQFYYRATPAVAWNLIKDHDIVIKMDADQVITGNISHTWEGDFDVAMVNNSNPREMKKYPVNVWNIHPLSYINCGFVVMKSQAFIDHWLGLCVSPHFLNYQFREQDLLNIMVFYMGDGLRGPYKVKFLDGSQYAHGLVTRGYELQFELRDNKLILPKNEEWNKEDKIVKVIHWAGGNQPDKMNFNIQFKEDVAKWLQKITK